MSTHFALRTHLDPCCVQTADQASIERPANLLAVAGFADPALSFHRAAGERSDVPRARIQ
ncbi:hypothetical protein BD310DRAFT_1008980, partial [Dichomitus squalens]